MLWAAAAVPMHIKLGVINWSPIFIAQEAPLAACATRLTLSRCQMCLRDALQMQCHYIHSLVLPARIIYPHLQVLMKTNLRLALWWRLYCEPGRCDGCMREQRSIYLFLHVTWTSDCLASRRAHNAGLGVKNLDVFYFRNIEVYLSNIFSLYL